jgi:uncharacterized protein YigE (DUF2233 family)
LAIKRGIYPEDPSPQRLYIEIISLIQNVHIRNGVGILPNGNPLFVITTSPVNLYDFANYYRKQGCKNALYLNGFVSRFYLPEVGIQQMDGKFRVMIAEVE